MSLRLSLRSAAPAVGSSSSSVPQCPEPECRMPGTGRRRRGSPPLAGPRPAAALPVARASDTARPGPGTRIRAESDALPPGPPPRRPAARPGHSESARRPCGDSDSEHYDDNMICINTGNRDVRVRVSDSRRGSDSDPGPARASRGRARAAQLLGPGSGCPAVSDSQS